MGWWEMRVKTGRRSTLLFSHEWKTICSVMQSDCVTPSGLREGSQELDGKKTRKKKINLLKKAFQVSFPGHSIDGHIT